jgi:hypothetical protein
VLLEVSDDEDHKHLHALPENPNKVYGVKFDVDFHNVWHNNKRLVASRLGYFVKYKSMFNGSRQGSSIWGYGLELEYTFDNGKRKQLYLCKACHEDRNCRNSVLIIDGTTHIRKHLERVHHINVKTGESTLGDLPPDPFTKARTPQRVAGSSSEPSHTPWEEQQLQAALVDWVITQDLSFSDVVSPATRGLITWNKMSLLRALPNSVTTLSTYVKKRLEDRKSEVVSLLASAQSKISISVDMWTSNNHYSFLAVVAHFVDATYNQRDVLVAFRNLFGDHTGRAQASVVLKVVQEYNFERQFNCFVSDNAKNNDLEFMDHINNNSDFVVLDPSHRIRCTGHIINLIVKATLYGKVSKFERELAEAAPQAQFEMWRKHGVVGKLHNFVNAVCGSHKRRERFQKIQKEVEEEDPLWTFAGHNLRQDGGVRWNSVYAMLNRCRELKPAVNKFIRACRNDDGFDDDDDATANPAAKYNPLIDQLNDDDWEEVELIINFLEVPFQLTKAVEGNNSNNGFGSLWQTLVDLQTLWVHYNEYAELIRERPSAYSPYFKTAVNMGWEKLDGYWKKVVFEPTPSYYCIATALHPRLRLTWFKDHWRDFPAWHHKAEQDLRKVFGEYLAASDAPDEAMAAEELRRQPPVSHTNSPFARTMAVDTMLLTGNHNHRRQQQKKELDRYIDDLQEDLTNDSKAYQELLDDPWQWWKQVGRSKYPILFQMAADFLSIPCTSCECERCFSSAKRTLPTDRNSLSPSSIEACQLQKNWVKNGVVASSLSKLSAHVISMDKATKKQQQ